MSKPHFDCLIAGAGFSGAVAAERLAENGKTVLVVDTRPHVGGDSFDHLDAAGVLVQPHGPQVFHTNSFEIFSYLSRFTDWRPYEHRVLAQLGEALVPLPVNLDTVNRLYGWDLTPPQLAAHLARVCVPMAQLHSLEDVLVNRVGRELYERLFHGWFRKQWGREPSQLLPTALPSPTVRVDRDDRSFTDRYQAAPSQGYTSLFKHLLSHRRIRVELETDYRAAATRVNADQLIFTGRIDEYFGSCYGPLPWRCVEYRFETLDEPLHQSVAEIVHPNDHLWSRVTEFKHLTGQQGPVTTLAYEFPGELGEPRCPVPCPENAARHRQYLSLAERTAGVHFLGRLSTYRCSEIDHRVAQALALASTLLGNDHQVPS